MDRALWTKDITIGEGDSLELTAFYASTEWEIPQETIVVVRWEQTKGGDFFPVDTACTYSTLEFGVKATLLKGFAYLAKQDPVLATNDILDYTENEDLINLFRR